MGGAAQDIVLRITEIICELRNGTDMLCSSCGKQHSDQLPLDIAYRRPAHYFMVPETERKRRIRESDDLCVIDDRQFLVRGVLYVPILGTSASFGWGFWSLVPEEKFRIIVRRWKEDASDEPVFEGTLSVDPPGYEGLLGQPVTVQLGSVKSRPQFTFPNSARHLLAREQRDGISLARAHEIVRMALPHLFD